MGNGVEFRIDPIVKYLTALFAMCVVEIPVMVNTGLAKDKAIPVPSH